MQLLLLLLGSTFGYDPVYPNFRIPEFTNHKKHAATEKIVSVTWTQCHLRTPRSAVINSITGRLSALLTLPFYIEHGRVRPTVQENMPAGWCR